MRYTITIRKYDKNPDYAVQMAKYEKERNRGYYNSVDPIPPKEEIVHDALICELTEEQFKKIKAESLKVFE